MNYTKRYRVEAAVTQQCNTSLPDVLFSVMDYCVHVGQKPKCISIGKDALAAVKEANELNRADSEAKTAWDAEHRAKDHETLGRVGVDMAAPGTKDETAIGIVARAGVFSMDMETHAKRYFIGAKGLAVYGSHEAIDHLRGKLNCRYRQIMDLGHINKNLRSNLKDAQAAADKFKAERDAALSCLKLVQER